MTREQIVHADQWRIKHRDHVARLIAGTESGGRNYEPSREDVNRPELWKPAHWRWFTINA